jgi:hypothetical protein
MRGKEDMGVRGSFSTFSAAFAFSKEGIHRCCGAQVERGRVGASCVFVGTNVFTARVGMAANLDKSGDESPHSKMTEATASRRTPKGGRTRYERKILSLGERLGMEVIDADVG